MEPENLLPCSQGPYLELSEFTAQTHTLFLLCAFQRYPSSFLTFGNISHYVPPWYRMLMALSIQWFASNEPAMDRGIFSTTRPAVLAWQPKQKWSTVDETILCLTDKSIL